MVDVLRQKPAVVRPARLVAMCHQHEGGMIAVVLENAVGFLPEPAVHGLAVAERGGLVGPHGGLDLQVEPRLVRCHKRRFGRTPGMKAQHVQPMGLGHAQNAFPFTDVRGRMTGLGENRTLQCAAEKCLPSVDRELGAVAPDVTQTEDGAVHRLASRPRVEDAGQLVDRRRELIPQRRRRAQIQFHLEGPAIRIPRQFLSDFGLRSSFGLRISDWLYRSVLSLFIKLTEFLGSKIKILKSKILSVICLLTPVIRHLSPVLYQLPKGLIPGCL